MEITEKIAMVGVPNRNHRVWPPEAIQRALEEGQRLAASGAMYGAIGVDLAQEGDDDKKGSK